MMSLANHINPENKLKLYFVPAKIHSYTIADNFGLGRAVERFAKLFYTEAP